jgi:hypothetical protein
LIEYVEKRILSRLEIFCDYFIQMTDKKVAREDNMKANLTFLLAT